MYDTLCQCCLTKSCYKKINSEIYVDGVKVIYVDIIRETFNITISSGDFICEQCIKMTQDAFKFKNQIIKSQEQLNKLTDSQIKLDIRNYNIVINDKLLDIDKKEIFGDTGNYAEPVSEAKIIYNHTALKQNEIEIEGNSEKPLIREVKPTINQRAIRDDSLKLLKYSNMCLFKSLKTKFGCYNCKESYINMSELRKHSQVHYTSSKDFKFSLKGYAHKNADISSLTCKLCDQACADLNLLRNHLENKHNIEFNSTEHIFVQYNLENGLKCVECGEFFNTFVRLSSHMNGHSTNNVCEICGGSFINRLSLRLHLNSVHKEKKCSLCSARFEKSYAKAKHMRTVHSIGFVKRYCTLCDKDFKYSYKLIEHRIEEHGVKRETAKCNDCGKNFLSVQNLKVHIRSVHIKERNFGCDVCGMRFFTKVDEKRHSRSHQDVKSFSCSFCEGKFKSKDSWRRHLKRLHSGQVSMIK